MNEGPVRVALQLCALHLCAVTMFGCGAQLRERGYLAVDMRVFPESPKYAGQNQGTGPSVAVEPELSLQSDDTNHTATLRPFLRVDAQDSARTHFDLRRADYVFADEGWELGLGVGQFRWGVREGYRLPDIVNAADLVEDINGQYRLGQPYVRAARIEGSWTFEALYLPYSRPQTYPGVAGRLRTALPIDAGSPEYEAAIGPWHPTAALRIAFSEGDFDLALSGLSGISREPTYLLGLRRAQIAPRYDFLQQASLDAQWTQEGFALRVEGALRWYSAEMLFSWALGTGLEYTFSDFAGTGVDLTLLTEHTYDVRPLDTPYTWLDNDVFYGLRLALNDEDGTEFRAGGITDLVHGATFLRAEARRRIGDHLLVVLSGQIFAVPEGRIESAFHRDSFVELRLAYFL